MGKLGPADYYKIAEERIGQYDGYGVRCKQWLVLTIAAFVMAAARWPHVWGYLSGLGVGAVFLLFLFEMTYRSTSMRLQDYCKELENLVDPRPDSGEPGRGTAQESQGDDHRFAHAMKPATKKAWELFGHHAWAAAFRPGQFLPYGFALLVVAVGCWGASEAASTAPPTTQPHMSPRARFLGIAVGECVMIALTLFIIVLTIAVCRYAKRTLAAAQESLDFFAKPLVTARKYDTIHTDKGTRVSVMLVNESAMRLRVEDVQPHILFDKSSASAKDLALTKRAYYVDGRFTVSKFPLFPEARFLMEFVLTEGAPLKGAASVVVALRINYVYRGHSHTLAGEFMWELGPGE